MSLTMVLVMVFILLEVTVAVDSLSYPLTVATDPDGTANNGDETYTVGAEVTNLTGELDTYDGTDNSTFIGDLDGTTDKITSPAPAPSPSTPPVPEAGPVHELNDGTSDGLYLVGGDSGSGFKFYPLTVATDPDGTANNGDETYTVGAEVTNLTGELDTYDGTDNSTFIGDLDGTTDKITSPAPAPSPSTPPVPEAGPVHELNDGTSDGLYLVGGDSGSGFKFYPLTVATDPDGTANNGDETYTVGAEVTNLTGELDTYDGTDNSTFIGDLDGTIDKITSPAPAPSPSTPPVPEAGPVHELNDECF